jgi:exopolysaccharide biosynthesis polyprenyl glycosylphosphotransferase
MNNKLKKIFFLLGDIFVLHLSLAITLFIRYRLIDGIDGISPYWRLHWLYFVGVFIIFLIIFYINNLYSLREMSSAKLFAKKTLKSVIVACILSALYFYLYPRIDIAPKTNLIIFALSSLTAFLVWRRLAYWLLSSKNWQNKLVILGYDDKIEALVAQLKNRPGLGYQSVMIFKDHSDLIDRQEELKNSSIRLVVLNDNIEMNQELQIVLLKMLEYKMSFLSYPDFYEQIHAKIPVEALKSDWFLDNLKEGEKNYFDAFKNLSDRVMATIFFVVSLVLWPFIIIIIKLESKGPVIFKQTRTGKNGKQFKLHKFRSMRVERNSGEMTKENDDRITRFGRFMRKTRLDEIPQLINIIKGNMSFIGPRPERPELIADLSKLIPFYNTRLIVKPGLTGWDQISGQYHSPSPEDTMAKLQNDLYYIKHRSLYLDLSIILKTIATVLARRGR